MGNGRIAAVGGGQGGMGQREAGAAHHMHLTQNPSGKAPWLPQLEGEGAASPTACRRLLSPIPEGQGSEKRWKVKEGGSMTTQEEGRQGRACSVCKKTAMSNKYLESDPMGEGTGKH